MGERIDLNFLKNAVVIIGFIGLIGGATGIALNEFLSEASVGKTTTIANHSVTISSDSGSVDQAPLFLAHTALINSSGSANIMGSANLSSDGTITCNASACEGTVKIDYTHTTPTAARNITTNGFLGVSNSTSFLDTIGTIAGVAVLIGIVVFAFIAVKR